MVQAEYILNEQYSNLNRYLDVFYDLKNGLEKKYGNQNAYDVTWHNDLYQDDQQQWGFAISIGSLSVYTEWNTAETLINIAIYGENNTIVVMIEYTSKKLIHMHLNQLEQSLLSDL